MASKLMGYLRLMRPANLPTAAADILAGAAIAGFFESDLEPKTLFLLILSSVFLYAGGVVLNDVFDFPIDKTERPERPIPSGLISLRSAALFGSILLITGIVFAFLANSLSGTIAVSLAATILLYDSFSKNYNFLGPLNMGLCRALNLILGMSIFESFEYWWYAIIPLVYIFAITLISRGEVHGGNKIHIIWAGILYVIVILVVVLLIESRTNGLLQTLPFLVLFSFFVFKPLIKAYRLNSPENIKKSVMAGVISLIVLDASLAAGFSNWWYGLLALLLLPLSLFLSRAFAVT